MTDQRPTVDAFRTDLQMAAIEAAAAANTRAIAMQAYLYALPPFLHLRQLVDFVGARQYQSPGEAPMGGWFLVRGLSDPKTRTVMPNVDTLYGACYLLLDEQGPVVLSVPPIDDRYYSVEMLDAYLNNFAVVSPRTYGSAGGHYLITPPGWVGETPAGITATIAAPTPAIALFQRIFAHNASEYERLYKLQDAFAVGPLAGWGKAGAQLPAVDLGPVVRPGLREVRDPLTLFEHTNYYMQRNPPPVEDRSLAALFASAGLGPGASLPESPVLRAAVASGAEDAQAAINARLSAGPFRNGWRVPDPLAGRAGPHLLSRAATQIYQFGSFVPEEATYFFAFKDAHGEALHGSRRYTFTFAAGALPPLAKTGFWSLTMYNELGFLVENTAARYAIRPDTPGLAYGADESLTVCIQHETPEGAAASNWLPTPEGTFFVGLRTYLPQMAIQDGSWFPPAVAVV